tara:strand:- start:663 stop:1694 length:1032 start_codon:yes stop_codon:yes gene_type:complete
MALWRNFLETTSSEQHSSEYEEAQKDLVELWRAHAPKQGADEYTQLEARIYRIGNQKGQRHLCTPFCCNHPPWATEANFVGAILDVFYNAHTKDFHLCNGPHCGGKHVFTEGISTCTISGMQFTEQKWVNSFKLNHEYHRTSCSTVRVETSLLKDMAKGLIQKFLFSETRRLAEAKKRFDTRKEICKAWVKDKRELERSKTRLSAIDFITKSFDLQEKRNTKDYRIPPPETQEMIFEFYSQKICAMFLKLKTLTNFSVETLNVAFVCALLYLMRKGLVINDIAIVPKDYYLYSSLPPLNCLDQYKVSKTHFTNSKTIICSCLRDAILGGVNPHHLLVSSLQPS